MVSCSQTKRHYNTCDTSDHRNLIKNTIAGTLQAGVAHILVPADGKFATAIDKGYQNEWEIQGQTRQHSRSNAPLVMKQTYDDENRMDCDTTGH